MKTPSTFILVLLISFFLSTSTARAEEATLPCEKNSFGILACPGQDISQGKLNQVASVISSIQSIVSNLKSLISNLPAPRSQLAQISGAGSGLVAHYTFDLVKFCKFYIV